MFLTGLAASGASRSCGWFLPLFPAWEERDGERRAVISARLGTLLLALCWLSVSAPPTASSAPARFQPTAPFREDQILLKPKAGGTVGNLDKFHAQRGSRILKHFKHLGDIQVLKLPKGRNVQQVLAEYQASGLVEFAEPDYLVEPALAPDDPKFQDGSLWHLRNNGQAGGVLGADIHAPDGWETLHSASDIIVAIVDSGVRYTHEDLAANMWVNPGEIPDNGLDDDGNGFVDDVHGINAAANTGNPIDLEGHGTQIAGLLGAVGNNSLGIVGVAWKVKLMACRYSDDVGMGTISDVVECIDYARLQGAHIINASFIIGMYSSTLYAAISSCRAQGILLVAAAGNSGRDNNLNAAYPANFDLDNIVSVAATTRADTLASFSNFGATSVDLAAPGSGVFTTQSGSDDAYISNSGTSFAAPVVAGAFALLKARYPDETYRQLIDRLLAATDRLPSLAGKCVTGGRLNIARALGPASTALQVLPGSDLVAGGFVGGPFAPETQVYTVINSGGGTLRWSVSHTAAWVTLSAASGTLAAQTSARVIVSINSLANELPPGEAADTLVFTNTGDGNGNTNRTVELTLKPLPRLSLARSPTSGQLEFRLNGEPGRSYIIQATTNLIQWTPVRTNSANADGMLSFADLPSPDAPKRFFRAFIAP